MQSKDCKIQTICICYTEAVFENRKQWFDVRKGY